jgi:hypothetical protein
MPYIPQKARGELIGAPHRNPATAGELNYIITEALIGYTRVHGLSYKTLNEVIGVLECAKQEYYRRLATPYEESKILENGDVYL